MEFQRCLLFFAVIIGSSSAQNLIGSLLKGFVVDCMPIKTLLGVEYWQLKNTKAEPNVSLVTLHLYAKISVETIFTLPGAADQLLQSTKFDRSLPTVIYAHGFLETPDWQSIQTMITSLIEKGGHNVFLLDSSKLIGSKYYYSSTAVHFIGDALGKELASLVEGGYPREKIHIIGFSLGGQIVGFTGKMFQTLSGSLLPRITSLDPAGPCFFENDESLRLASSDAEFVEVIHVNAGFVGMTKAIGHADFYPNGGTNQPGCLEAMCNHFRGWEYYSESILQERNFLAVTCSSWLDFESGGCYHNPRVVMGYATPNTTRGVYYLKTNAFKPFGLGNESVPENFLNSLFPDFLNSIK